jgi:membrane protein implicated in regulation of membrane protease activity
MKIDKDAAIRAAEAVAVCTGAALGISALAALPWYLSVAGFAIVTGAWSLMYKIFRKVADATSRNENPTSVG